MFIIVVHCAAYLGI